MVFGFLYVTPFSGRKSYLVGVLHFTRFLVFAIFSILKRARNNCQKVERKSSTFSIFGRVRFSCLRSENVLQAIEIKFKKVVLNKCCLHNLYIM